MSKKRKKPKKVNKKKTARRDYPFEIHACPETEMPQFCTHTHNLSKIGFPEILMDPCSLGPKGNGARIDYGYEYFIKPESASELKAILGGQIVKLTLKHLTPDIDVDEPYTYCFREVSPIFEAVRQSYIVLGPGIDPGMRFIQIWIEGDDFALEDEYYRDGVWW